MRTWHLLALLLLLAGLASGASPAEAHVPYIERVDISAARPFTIQDVAQSKAFYAWLQTADDVDYLEFEVTDPVRVYTQAIVPVCPGYEQFLPWLAVIGPGLPPPTEALPAGYTLPPGYGAIVVPNVAPGQPRDTFYEPFGGKFYYDAPLFDQVVSTPGQWAIIYYDLTGGVGDYVGVVGIEERFRGADILRSLINTPIIRNDGELHVPCD